MTLLEQYSGALMNTFGPPEYCSRRVIRVPS